MKIKKYGINLPFTYEELRRIPEDKTEYRKVPLTKEQREEKRAVKKALKLLEHSEFVLFDRDGGYEFYDKPYNLERIEPEED